MDKTGASCASLPLSVRRVGHAHPVGLLDQWFVPLEKSTSQRFANWDELERTCPDSSVPIGESRSGAFHIATCWLAVGSPVSPQPEFRIQPFPDRVACVCFVVYVGVEKVPHFFPVPIVSLLETL